MACSKQELIDWLENFPADAEVAIDDGGLTLVITDNPDAYFTVGGIPDPEDQ